MGPGQAVVFRRGARVRVVAWSHRRAAAQLPMRGRVAVRDLLGRPVRTLSGPVALTEDPVYAECAPGGVDVMGRATPEPRNLVTNPDLQEQGTGGTPYGWHRGMFYGGADKGEFLARAGTAGGMVGLQRTEEAFWQSFPVPAMPGERYRLTAEMRAESATGDNGVQILFLAGPGWGWRGGPTSRTVTGDTNGWITVSVEGTVPHDADVVRANLSSKGNRGTVWFRKVRLERLDSHRTTR